MTLFAFAPLTQAILCWAVLIGMFVLFARESYPTEVVAISRAEYDLPPAHELTVGRASQK